MHLTGAALWWRRRIGLDRTFSRLGTSSPQLPLGYNSFKIICLYLKEVDGHKVIIKLVQISGNKSNSYGSMLFICCLIAPTHL